MSAYLWRRTARLGEYGLEVGPQEADEYNVIDEQVHRSDFGGRDPAWKTDGPTTARHPGLGGGGGAGDGNKWVKNK